LSYINKKRIACLKAGNPFFSYWLLIIAFPASDAVPCSVVLNTY